MCNGYHARCVNSHAQECSACESQVGKLQHSHDAYHILHAFQGNMM